MAGVVGLIKGVASGVVSVASGFGKFVAGRVDAARSFKIEKLDLKNAASGAAGSASAGAAAVKSGSAGSTVKSLLGTAAIVGGTSVISSMLSGSPQDNKSDNDTNPDIRIFAPQRTETNSVIDNSTVVYGDGNSVSGGAVDAITSPSASQKVTPSTLIEQGLNSGGSGFDSGSLLSGISSKTLLTGALIVGGVWLLGKFVGRPKTYYYGK